MPDIEQTYEIAAPRERVFRALTDADELTSWWTTRASSEPRAGGAFLYEWDFEDASRNWRQEGAYIEVDPPESVSYPWAVRPGVDTTVRFTLADAPGGGTELRLSHTGFPAEAAEDHARHGEGWGLYLGNLKSVLEGGPDRRPEVGLKTPVSR